MYKFQKTKIVLVLAILCQGCINNSSHQKKDHSATSQEKKEGIKPEIDKSYIHRELENTYSEILEPISDMKTSHEDVYWFIVSWLGTQYNTPSWKGYNNTDWVTKTKQKGIDCSGFARVMLEEIFDKKVRGGSQGILDHYCTRIDQEDLEMGDLVFFKAPYSKNDRIVHVGVYLKDTYFVHATSTKSAAEGLGVNINSLEEENWAIEYVSGGRVKR